MKYYIEGNEVSEEIFEDTLEDTIAAWDTKSEYYEYMREVCETQLSDKYHIDIGDATSEQLSKLSCIEDFTIEQIESIKPFFDVVLLYETYSRTYLMFLTERYASEEIHEKLWELDKYGECTIDGVKFKKE